MRKILNKIHTLIILILAAGAPVVTVVPEQYWFEKRVALAVAALVVLALWASRIWLRGRSGKMGEIRDIGWIVFGGALIIAAVVPAGRIANLMALELWVGVGAVLAFFAIKNTTTSSKMIKWGFGAAVVGVVVAGVVIEVGRGWEIWEIGGIREQGRLTLEILQRSPIWGEFREFRAARLGILQVASGLGILGILGTLALVYQLGLKSVKGIFKSSSVWWKVLNLLVLVLLAGFLVLPHPALTLWPLAVAAALAQGISVEEARQNLQSRFSRVKWAVFVGLLVVVILGSSYGLGRVVWGELKFREALAAANRNEGIATYYALLESIKRNPYEVRYYLLASQIDIALANSIAAQAQISAEEATPSAQLSAQDRNNILILIQQAVVEGKAAIKLDPENSLLWQNLAAIYRGLIGVAGGAEDWALKSYQQAAELNPKDPNTHLFIGEIHFLAGNFQGAVDSFKEAVGVDPNFVRAHYDLAVAYNALNEIDQAIEELERVLEILPADDPGREQVEKDLAFLKEPSSDESGLSSPPSELSPGEFGSETEELKEATSSAEVEAPPPPVGPKEATESAEPKPTEVIP